MLQTYLLNGDEGTCIKLWQFDSSNPLEVLNEAKHRLGKLGESVLPPKCVLVLRDTDEPPDMASYNARATLACREDEWGNIVSKKALSSVEFATGVIGKRIPNRHLRAHFAEEEAEKLAECERDEAFGLERCIQEPELLFR